jgi:GTP cyclohydrolase IV
VAPRTPTTDLPIDDLQNTAPPLAVSLSRAGIVRSPKAIGFRRGDDELVLLAEVACSVDLSAGQKGAHMSRFEEVINEAIDQMIAGPVTTIDGLAKLIAVEIAARQGATRSRVEIRASYPVVRRTPVSDLESQEMYGMLAIAAAGPSGARSLIGATAQGMNACPCAQGLLRDQAAAALGDDGFSTDEIDRVLSLVPVATHNQRARGTLFVGSPGASVPVDPDLLIEIIEASMSSEIYELMKRTDERFVVDRAHRRPRFVEDSVREMLGGVLLRLPDLPDDAFVSATQVNFETIHTHDVEAARTAMIGDLRTELTGVGVTPSEVTLDAWLLAGPTD